MLTFIAAIGNTEVRCLTRVGTSGYQQRASEGVQFLDERLASLPVSAGQTQTMEGHQAATKWRG